jgi:hypothetical protein
MMGDEWPTRRVFPNRTANDGDNVRLGGLTLSVRELGPGVSHVDTVWQLDPSTIFAGDVAYNGMHAYLADGRWREWLVTLDRLEAELPDDVTLYVGHGPPGGKDLLAAQRRYIETFVDAVEAHAEAIEHGDHSGVIEAMKRLLPTDSVVPDGPEHRAHPSPYSAKGPCAPGPNRGVHEAASHRDTEPKTPHR